MLPWCFHMLPWCTLWCTLCCAVLCAAASEYEIYFPGGAFDLEGYYGTKPGTYDNQQRNFSLTLKNPPGSYSSNLYSSHETSFEGAQPKSARTSLKRAASVVSQVLCNSLLAMVNCDGSSCHFFLTLVSTIVFFTATVGCLRTLLNDSLCFCIT